MPPLIHVVPPKTARNTAATPTANSVFEISPARQSPNAPDMISMARGNDVNTASAHEKSFRADVSAKLPEPAIEYASDATTAICRRDNAPNAALDAIAATPQPS